MKAARPLLAGAIATCILASALLGLSIYHHTKELRHQERLLTAALRFCNDLGDKSRNITTLARNAVIMNDQDATLAFQRIQDMRRSLLQSPFTVETGAGEAVSLKQLLTRLRLPNTEAQYLRHGYALAEQLSQSEIEAVHVAHGLARDEAGNYTRAVPPDREKALDLLFNESYRLQQHEINENINKAHEALIHLLSQIRQQGENVINNQLLGLGGCIFVALACICLLALQENRQKGTSNVRLLAAFAVTILMVLGSVAGPAWLVYQDASHTITDTFEKRQSLLAHSIQRELQLHIDHALNLARIVSSMVPVRALFSSQPSAADHGTVLRTAQELLQHFCVSQATVARALVLDKANRVLIQGAEREAGAHITALPPDVFHKLLMGQSQILPLPGPQGEELLLAVPITPAGSGAVNGGLVLIMNTQRIFDFEAGRLDADERAGIVIMDRSGVIIGSTDANAPQGQHINSPHVCDFLDTQRAGLLQLPGRNGEERLGYFLPIHDLHWTVGIFSSHAGITRLTKELMMRAAIFAGVGGLLTILLISCLLRYVTRKLRRSNERTANIIEAAGMFTWDYDIPTGALHHNAQFCRSMQLPGPAQDGIVPFDWLRARLHPEDLKHMHSVADSAGKGSFFNYPCRLRMPSGEYRWFSCMGRVEEVDSLGNTLRMAGTGFDIHDQKVTEISDDKYKQQLQDLVEKRTRELLESRNQAEAASQAKSAFLSTMSHEIRTPMNAILGFTYLFRRSNLDESQRAFLDKIRLSADTLLNIINDVLDIAKIEAGKLELERVPFSLRKVLHTVQSVAEYAALENNLELTVDVAKNVPAHVYGDPKRITQILLNLVNNAVKFTSEGSVKVDMRLHDTASAASGIPAFSDECNPGEVLVAVRVSDTGIGISTRQQERLFKPFSQADSSVTRKFGGTGLGLAICKELVDRMGGIIGVQSRPGQGSTFFFTLRLEEARDVPEENLMADMDILLATQENAALHALRVNAGSRILVVEDNPINQEIVLLMLEKYGMLVDMAENGREALDRVGQQTYNLILMDMQMPVMGGEEATRCLRDLADLPGFEWLGRTPIIAITANAMSEDRERCLKAGMNDHLAKPFDPAALRDMLLRWLK